jgi:hypothetical protein
MPKGTLKDGAIIHRAETRRRSREFTYNENPDKSRSGERSKVGEEKVCDTKDEGRCRSFRSPGRGVGVAWRR